MGGWHGFVDSSLPYSQATPFFRQRKHGFSCVHFNFFSAHLAHALLTRSALWLGGKSPLPCSSACADSCLFSTSCLPNALPQTRQAYVGPACVFIWRERWSIRVYPVPHRSHRSRREESDPAIEAEQKAEASKCLGHLFALRMKTWTELHSRA